MKPGTRSPVRLALAAAAATASLACACAHAAEPMLSPGDGVVFEVSQSAAQPLALPAADNLAPAAQPAFRATTQTMLWARKQGLAAGVGVEQRWQPQDGRAAAPNANISGQAQGRAGGVLLGVSLATSDTSTVVWQTPLVRGDDRLAQAQAFGLQAAQPADRQMRLGLNFHARDPYSDLRRGSLMKVELSGPATVFSLRPRGGRLAMVLSSKW